METPNSSFGAPEAHEDHNDQPDAYGLYPASWRRPTARETSETKQHQTRETGGGLGLAGYDAEYLAAAPQRPLSLAVAAVESEVRLG
jgi:hypothetical protein